MPAARANRYAVRALPGKRSGEPARSARASVLVISPRTGEQFGDSATAGMAACSSPIPKRLAALRASSPRL